ncbi:MAG: hypothetical protein IIX93_00355, partial [Clostridia bacterium]|nr:hypothetical protein [Clostridia bacterium]
MQKLYEKSQLALALIMIGIYVLVTGFLDGISKYYTTNFRICKGFLRKFEKLLVFFTQKIRNKAFLC